MLERDKKNAKKRLNINDVARLAGVSVGTVSRALNGVGYVKEETRRRIKDAVNELGYVTNRAGRTLKTSKTGLVMLAIPDTSNEIYFGMIEAFQSELKKKNLSMLLYYTDGQHAGEMCALRMLEERLIDGLFMVHFHYNDDLYEAISDSISPIVLCGMCNHLWTGEDKSFDTISIDVYQGIYNTITHLIKMGNKRIGYLAGTNGIEVYRQRHQAYMDALRDNDIEYREDYVVWSDYSENNGYNGGRALYQMKDRPTAICASNDQQAIGCWKALRDLNARIPDDMALTGLDNLKIVRMLEITSVDMKESHMGREAANLLLHRMDEPNDELASQDIYYRPELIVRESSLKQI
ncbi:MAG: LacI family DNA-binding transcriptional regulator [Clostridia bacterium]|nr:LacI family DNA-binding transcriptional regulator [Clostridia bacterium]